MVQHVQQTSQCIQSSNLPTLKITVCAWHMLELVKYVQQPLYHHPPEFSHFKQPGQGTLCFVMQMRTSYVQHIACASTVAQRPHTGAQHAHLWTHCTPIYHQGTQQHTDRTYPRTHCASSIKTWLEHFSGLEAWWHPQTSLAGWKKQSCVHALLQYRLSDAQWLGQCWKSTMCEQAY